MANSAQLPMKRHTRSPFTTPNSVRAWAKRSASRRNSAYVQRRSLLTAPRCPGKRWYSCPTHPLHSSVAVTPFLRLPVPEHLLFQSLNQNADHPIEGGVHPVLLTPFRNRELQRIYLRPATSLHILQHGDLVVTHPGKSLDCKIRSVLQLSKIQTLGAGDFSRLFSQGSDQLVSWGELDKLLAREPGQCSHRITGHVGQQLAPDRDPDIPPDKMGFQTGIIEHTYQFTEARVIRPIKPSNAYATHTPVVLDDVQLQRHGAVSCDSPYHLVMPHNRGYATEVLQAILH